MDAPSSLQQESAIYRYEAVSGIEECAISNLIDNNFRRKQIPAHSWLDIDSNSITHTIESVCLL